MATTGLEHISSKDLLEELNRRTGNHPRSEVIETYQGIKEDIVAALDHIDVPDFDQAWFKYAEWIEIRAGEYSDSSKTKIERACIHLPLITRKQLLSRTPVQDP